MEKITVNPNANNDYKVLKGLKNNNEEENQEIDESVLTPENQIEYFTE